MRPATIRKPAFSKRRRTSPIRFFSTPSGLTIDRVRSSAMLRILRILQRSGLYFGAQLYLPPARAAMNAARGSPRRKRRFRLFRLDGEAFAAAALALDVGIGEAKRFVQALFDEVND